MWGYISTMIDRQKMIFGRDFLPKRVNQFVGTFQSVMVVELDLVIVEDQTGTRPCMYTVCNSFTVLDVPANELEVGNRPDSTFTF